MAWLVGNMHHYKKKPLPFNAVYVARAPRGQPESILANPFVVFGKQTVFQLEEVEDPILAYRFYLFEHMQTDTPIRREIDRLARMEDGILLCWCSPRPCHGEVISRCIEWYRRVYLGVPNDV